KLIQGAAVLPLLGLILSIIGYLGPLPKSFTIEDFENNIKPQVALKAPQYESAVSDAYTKDDSLYKLNEKADTAVLRQTRIAFDTIKYKGTGASLKTFATPQTDSTQESIHLLSSLIPILFLTAGILASLKFKLNPETHKVLRNEMDRLNAGGNKEQAPPEVKEICKVLSGMDYEKIRI
ncbi:MAG TPA: hypothetical protein PLV76_04930, partial [Spirochaetales bacterium]|nr:hypothetical protein [Spirochaetales bacterium]